MFDQSKSTFEFRYSFKKINIKPIVLVFLLSVFFWGWGMGGHTDVTVFLRRLKEGSVTRFYLKGVPGLYMLGSKFFILAYSTFFISFGDFEIFFYFFHLSF